MSQIYNMITLISGTNRALAKTDAVTKYITDLLQELNIPNQTLYLKDLKADFLNDLMYSSDNQSEQLRSLQDEYICAADKFIIISPEYNGSFPGILKLFIDAISVREYAKNFSSKKIALVGVSSGWAGNFRGMDHLAEIFAHQGGLCMPKRMAIPNIEQNFDGKVFTDTKLGDRLVDFVKAFIAF